MEDARAVNFGLGPLTTGRFVLLGIILINAAIEAALWGADLGLWGAGRWRGLAYQYGGFWAGLLHDWQPNYAVQPVTMFVSYALLHAGPGHLIGNMGGLVFLGDLAVDRVGGRGFERETGGVVHDSICGRESNHNGISRQSNGISRAWRGVRTSQVECAHQVGANTGGVSARGKGGGGDGRIGATACMARSRNSAT